MQTKVRYLSDLKFNLETWRRELRFHFDEMDTFQEKLEEIAVREFGQDARKSLENFQNRIMIEKSAIAKLKHRCKNKLRNIHLADLSEDVDGRLRTEQSTLKEDMRTYIKMHYDLKEEMMDYFAEYLVE
ncbi:MAG: hypothetical protein KJO05_02185 [Bacteroidia bacterium]|nr:hypothetical protein [Bacteroidia bacterium]NNF29744.1 hypothetical protein [Flavobacteriaceae bacterium]MBT8276092.1 hypothetical protein [Bacteroidia bacterium]NNJ82483.1 hypothetical protein [Flavobacteriaceae bacterium]NNK53633.1 hypothetical protein [Flavobacteriaceae bacterium]